MSKHGNLQHVFFRPCRRFSALAELGAVSLLVLFFGIPISGQNSQFEFDANGNLQAQAGEIDAPPLLLSPPQPQVVAPGALASFMVVAANTHNLSYQWRFNGANIPGATNDALLLQNIGATNEGQYFVVLVNSSGSVTSTPAALLLDGDRDGLADAWELASFGNLNQYPSGDADGDGVSNRDEFLDGTNPADSASVLFRLTLLSDGGQVVVNPSRFTFTSGEMVTLTALGLAPGSFHGWTGDTNTTNPTISLVMTNHKTVFAHLGVYDLTWTNAVSGDWNVASNWSPNFVPGTNDNVFITSGVTVTLNTKAACGSLTLSAGTLAGSGVLTLYRDSAWSGGTMTGSGRTIIPQGAALTITGGTVALTGGRILDNGGTTFWNSGNIQSATATVITNRPGALFQVQSAATITAGAGGGRFDNAGTFRKASAGTTTINTPVSFNNYGAFELQSGTLVAAGGGLNNGAMDISAAATLNFSGGTFTSSGASSIVGAGNLTFSSGFVNLAGLVHVAGAHTFTFATANLTGNYICTNNTVTISGATVTINGTGTVTPAVLNLSGGSLGGSQLVTVLSQMNWSGGTMTGSGRTIIPQGAALTITGGTVALTGGRILDNGGTTFWNSGNIQSATATVITNRPGALFQVQSAATITAGAGGGRFDNAGTFRKASAGTTTINTPVSFNNYNTVEIQSGILAPSGGYNSTANSLLNCAIGGTSVGTGYGRLQVSGAVTLNGALRVVLTNAFVPSTNDTFIVLTAVTRNGAFANFSYPSNEVSMLMSNAVNSVIVRVTEVLAGSQPSFLSQVISGTDIRLIWTARSNRTYRLEYNADPSSTNWLSLAGDITTLSNTASKLDLLTPTNRFYRVRVVP